MTVNFVKYSTDSSLNDLVAAYRFYSIKYAEALNPYSGNDSVYYCNKLIEISEIADFKYGIDIDTLAFKRS